MTTGKHTVIGYLGGREARAAHFDALETLRASIGLPVIPRHIECVDISTLQGSETVASMVVCEDGRMKRREYRKYRIKGLSASSSVPRAPEPQTQSPKPKAPPDAFAAMREVVQRRYRKMIEDG